MKLEKHSFGITADQIPVSLYTLTNDHGMEVQITNYGGIVVAWKAPDREGNWEDVVLGFETLDDYIQNNSPYLGALVGRYANRIAYGRFSIRGQTYQLATNTGEDHLHGGPKGFHQVVWEAQAMESEEEVSLELHYLSEEGEEGYPGNLSVTVTYTLTQENALKLAYTATTDQTTPINLTNHSYFNLSGNQLRPVHDCELMVNADQFTPLDARLIPTGELRSVKGTVLDFTRPVKMQTQMDQGDSSLLCLGGYDINFALNNPHHELIPAALVHEPQSGRVLEVFTTAPGMQLYTACNLDGSLTGKGGVAYERHTGICLETQHFPDSPNHSHFPSTLLNPGETYRQITVYQFSTK